jgi:hypothetical protein
MSADELRRKAADLRSLAGGCRYPEAIDLIQMVAEDHEEEAARLEKDAPSPAPASQPKIRA